MADRLQLNVRMDDATDRRLAALAAKLELPRAFVVRRAIRELAEREGVEQNGERNALLRAAHPATPDAPAEEP